MIHYSVDGSVAYSSIHRNKLALLTSHGSWSSWSSRDLLSYSGAQVHLTISTVGDCLFRNIQRRMEDSEQYDPAEYAAKHFLL